MELIGWHMAEFQEIEWDWYVLLITAQESTRAGS